jgi:hypothetical protein
MIVTRNIVNPSIKITDVDADWQGQVYDYQALDSLINSYKNLLQQDYLCQPGQKAVIGVRPGLAHMALIFACAELALTIVVVDHEEHTEMSLASYVAVKTNPLLPIDFFFVENDHRLQSWYKGKIFCDLCNQTIFTDHNDLDTTDNSVVLATSNSTLMLCCNNSTTDPQAISHTHKFIHDLVVRNSNMFFGIAGVFRNLQHGSSLATYCLPIMVSNKVTDIVNFQCQDRANDFWERLSSYPMNHLMIPYSDMIGQFFDAAKQRCNQDLIVYVLGFISSNWMTHIDHGKAKNIVSLFGSSETSGPIFVNQLTSQHEFDPRRFTKVDDFYQLDFDQNGIMTVKSPVSHCTNDRFEVHKDHYYYQGRSDLVRINNWPVNTAQYAKIAETHAKDCEIVIDCVENKIYLVSWGHIAQHQIDAIKQDIETASHHRHSIDKFATLDQAQFVCNKNIDYDMVQDHFKNYV